MLSASSSFLLSSALLLSTAIVSSAQLDLSYVYLSTLASPRLDERAVFCVVWDRSLTLGLLPFLCPPPLPLPCSFAPSLNRAAHNTTSLEGMWSTGSGAVQTGMVSLLSSCPRLVQQRSEGPNESRGGVSGGVEGDDSTRAQGLVSSICISSRMLDMAGSSCYPLSSCVWPGWEGRRERIESSEAWPSTLSHDDLDRRLTAPTRERKRAYRPYSESVAPSSQRRLACYTPAGRGRQKPGRAPVGLSGIGREGAAGWAVVCITSAWHVTLNGACPPSFRCPRRDLGSSSRLWSRRVRVRVVHPHVVSKE